MKDIYNFMKTPVLQKLLTLLALLSLPLTHAMGEFDTKATPIESISVKDGFEVELLFTVPKEKLGSWVNLNGDRVTLNTDLYDPNQRTSVLRKEIQSMGPSPVSPMPPGLLTMMEKEEIMDLLAYILSGGDKQHRFFAN